ncbi:MAG: hypothetical protein IJW31_05115, partial [Lentisphaeria bacterium]|nr:hypothetical protein [Lentisphaeria bacterium]
WSDLATSGNLPRCVATRGKRFEVSFRKKAGGQLENFATLKQSPNRHIAPTQITIVQPDGWLLGCGECNQLPTKKQLFRPTKSRPFNGISMRHASMCHYGKKKTVTIFCNSLF